MRTTEEQIVRKGLELGFSNVGFAELRDYPEYLQQARQRPHYDIFAGDDNALLGRLAHAKTLNPWGKSIVCATLGFAAVDYPEVLLRSVARAYLARVYTPPAGTVHAFQIEGLAQYLESLGMRVERNQFSVPQRLACAEASIVMLGNNNFAYTEQDGSFVILVTFVVDAQLRPSGSAVRNGCPEGCELCIEACPTGAMSGPCELDLDRCILFNNQRFAPGAQEDIWEAMGERIHGCDACQVVCPRNRKPLAPCRAEGSVPRMACRRVRPGARALLGRRLLQGRRPAHHVQLHQRSRHLSPQRGCGLGQYGRSWPFARSAPGARHVQESRCSEGGRLGHCPSGSGIGQWAA